MKTAARNWLVAALLLLLAALLLGAGTLMVAGVPFVEDYAPYRTAHSADVTVIRTDLKSSSILLIPTASDTIGVTCFDRVDSRRLHVSEQNGELVIEERIPPVDRFDMRNWISFGHRPTYDVEITVPRKFAGRLEIGTTSGYIECNDLSVSAAEFTAASGSVNLADFGCAGDFTLELSSGHVDLEHLFVEGNMEVSTTSGFMKLESVECTGDMRLSATSGSLHIDDALHVSGEVEITRSSGAVQGEEIRCRKLKISTTSGIIDLDVVSSVVFAAESSSGSIRVDMLDAIDTRLEATSGSIRAKMTEPIETYAINTSTTSGANNLPTRQAGTFRTIYARTTSGTIEIDFEQNTNTDK